ncbi:MAG: glycosyltransferase 87 family protein, partial [Candidatus Lokiarchaeota archaeon]|nr:glycosyltransferase 87 family protein [Candidatus Lokiarchaeota archaeon]
LCFFLVPLIIPIENTIIANDFRIFYQSAQAIITDPEQLYSLPAYKMPFRYLPFFSILFVPYTLIPFELGFVIHTFLLGLIQTASFYLIYIISTRFYKVKYNNKVKSDLLFICLMAPLQVPMILMGQISHIFILLILIVIFLIENIKTEKYEINYQHFLIGLILGFSISLKPYSILIIPLLIKLVITFEDKKIKIRFKILIKLLSGLIISHIINIIYFLVYPGLLPEFLEINSTTQLLNYPSSSITRLISFIFNSFSIEPIFMLILTILLYGLLFSIFLITPSNKTNYPAYVSMVILIIMINFTDSWFLNFLIVFMLIFPGLFQFEDEVSFIQSESLKRRLRISNFITYKIIYYGIIYFTVGVVLGLTVFPTDPILPFFLIILYLIILWRLFRNYR